MMIPLQRSVVVLALTALAALPGAPRTALGAPQQTTATVPTDAQAFAGTWLAESARINTNNSLSRVWRSKVTLT
ncbi:MAG TPA: hypothetical protein VFB66_18600, partial [Tepidisphaeraceae bacterium]|nr:hypothetical protein [Tepidisphaeraceae bacterium]